MRRHHEIPALWVACGVLATLLAIEGCNDRTTPPLATTEASQDVTSERPTTQELSSGPRKVLALASVPFRISVPESWEVKTIDNENYLVGPTPFGSVQIGLNQRPMMKSTYVDLMIQAAQKAAAADPNKRAFSHIQDLGGVKLLERSGRLVRIRSTLPTDALERDGLISPTMLWKISAFIPSGSEYDVFELNFLDLHQDQFDQDRAFLRTIIDSLQYDPAALAGS